MSKMEMPAAAAPPMQNRRDFAEPEERSRQRIDSGKIGENDDRSRLTQSPVLDGDTICQRFEQ